MNTSIFAHDLKAAYQREILRQPKGRLALYAVIVFLNALLIVMLGLKLSVFQLPFKIQRYYDLKAYSVKLEESIKQLESLEKEVTQAEEYEAELEMILPDEDVQNYLVDFVKAAASSGYIVKNFDITDSNENEAKIFISLSGSHVNIGKLITNIEGLKKLTFIETARVVPDRSNTTNVNLELLLRKSGNMVEYDGTIDLDFIRSLRGLPKADVPAYE